MKLSRFKCLRSSPLCFRNVSLHWVNRLLSIHRCNPKRAKYPHIWGKFWIFQSCRFGRFWSKSKVTDQNSVTEIVASSCDRFLTRFCYALHVQQVQTWVCVAAIQILCKCFQTLWKSFRWTHKVYWGKPQGTWHSNLVKENIKDYCSICLFWKRAGSVFKISLLVKEHSLLAITIKYMLIKNSLCWKDVQRH